VRFLAVAASLLVAHAFTLASDWRGEERLRGRVLAADGSPAAGAVVRLQLDPDSAGPDPDFADARGRFSVAGLVPGSWTITIDFEGHIVSRGRVTLKPGGGDAVEVRLRSLDEVPPAWSEEDASAIAEWIDRGNSFLRDGRYGEARLEYERALAELPWAEHPEILQAIARAFYLEGDGARAIEVLERALPIEPRSEDLRRLLVGVCDSEGRAAEARAFLDGLPSEPTEPPPGPADADAVDAAPGWPERPLLEPEPHRTGRFRVRLDHRSKIGTLDEYARRYGASVDELRSHDAQAGEYRIEDESFEVYVPSSYDPDVVHALFVWVSPTPFGGTERPETWKMLDERGVLWIGANRSGNDRSRWDRTGLALDAAEAMLRLYRIDLSRVWVGGYSGGGRVASGLALLYPQVFRGGLFVMGCDFYRDLPVSHVPGASWPASFRAPAGLRVLRREHRFVILTGSRDFNLSRSRAVHEAYLDEGFRHAVLLEVPGVSHYDAVPIEAWARALGFLEGRDAAPR
jgi:tetratricopeptide (TPR) repeat protein